MLKQNYGICHDMIGGIFREQHHLNVPRTLLVCQGNVKLPITVRLVPVVSADRVFHVSLKKGTGRSRETTGGEAYLALERNSRLSIRLPPFVMIPYRPSTEYAISCKILLRINIEKSVLGKREALVGSMNRAPIG